MKKQKILIDVRQSMAESTFGSTERSDEIDRIQAKYCLSSEALRKVCLGAPRADYWVR